ncbi:MAG: GNAT family N-acetyltransferase [Pseudomonadota bacterium]
MWPADFDPQPTLSGRGLALRPLTPGDRDALYAAASDPLIWEQHPVHDRHERAVFDPYFDSLLARGGALAMLDDGGTVIGTSSFYLTKGPPRCASIGFTFLARAHWGGPTNRAVKTLMLDHLFAHFDTAWFHIGLDNIRSQKGTAKLGAIRVEDDLLDIIAPPSLHAVYRLDRAAWHAD